MNETNEVLCDDNEHTFPSMKEFLLKHKIYFEQVFVWMEKSDPWTMDQWPHFLYRCKIQFKIPGQKTEKEYCFDFRRGLSHIWTAPGVSPDRKQSLIDFLKQNSLSEARDAYSFFGWLPEHPTKEDCMVELRKQCELALMTENESTPQSTNNNLNLENVSLQRVATKLRNLFGTEVFNEFLNAKGF
jgi:hypothetical protein